MQDSRKISHTAGSTLCYFHFTSTCTNGESCRFRHTTPYNLKLLKRMQEKITDFEVTINRATKEIVSNRLPYLAAKDMKKAIKSLNRYFIDFEDDYESRYECKFGMMDKLEESKYSPSKHNRSRSRNRNRSRSRSITRSTKSNSSDTSSSDERHHRTRSSRSLKHSDRNYPKEVSFLDFLDKKETKQHLIETPMIIVQDSNTARPLIEDAHIETWYASEYDLDLNTIILDVPYFTIDSSIQEDHYIRYFSPHIQTLDFLSIPRLRNSSAIIDSKTKAKLQFLGYDYFVTEPSSFMQVDKFNIVIDLDRTLIDSILKTDLKIPIKNYKYRIEEVEWTFKGVDYCYIVAIRPGIQEFLFKLSAFATLWLYTSAIVEYAEKVVKILDPCGKYFSDRIIGSANLNETKETKSLSKILQKYPEFDKSVCCILDDNLGVWAEDQDKLIPTMAFSPFKTYGKSKFTYHSMLSEHKFEDLRERFLDKPGTHLSTLLDIVMRTYREFVLHNCKITAAHAYELIRKRTLKDTKLSVNSYISKLDGKLYTGSKLQTYVYIAELLGAQITEENGKEIVEKAASGKEITGDELIKSYFGLCSL